MAVTDTSFLTRLTKMILGRAYAQARRSMSLRGVSQTLIEAMKPIVDAPYHARLYIPHYWAVYVHDGRGPFSAPSPDRQGYQPTYLVWFRNILNDPRLPNGEQVERFSQVRRLTREQFQQWMSLNRLADENGAPRPMIVVRSVNRPTPGTFFFENDAGGGMSGLLDEIRPDAQAMFSQHVRAVMGGLMNVRGRVKVQI